MSTTKYIVNNLSGQTITNEPILRPYKVYTALLQRQGPGLAPTATELENTLDAIITFVRTETGYVDILASSSVFTDGKTVISLNPIGWALGTIMIDNFGNTTSRKAIITSASNGASSDDVCESTFFEIRVYN